MEKGKRKGEIDREILWSQINGIFAEIQKKKISKRTREMSAIFHRGVVQDCI